MRRILASLLALLALVGICAAGPGAADPAKVLRVASPDIDMLDPQQYSDDPSFQVLMAIFEPKDRRFNHTTRPRALEVGSGGSKVDYGRQPPGGGAGDGLCWGLPGSK